MSRAPAATNSSTNKKVVLILDDSGSMYSTSYGNAFVKEIRERFDGTANHIESNEAQGTSAEAVVFWSEARSEKRLMGLPELSH